MMDLQSNDDIDLEDGELSASGDDEIYTPLQRPAPKATTPAAAAAMIAESVGSPLATCHQIQSALVDDESPSNTESSSGESSEEGCIKKLRTDATTGDTNKKRRKRFKRTVMVRVPPASNAESNRARFKKYNVWTAALQEDALSENMRGCDVTRNSRDRNVENYDFPLKYQVNGENSLKRRLSNSTDEEGAHPAHKRGRRSSRSTVPNYNDKRRSNYDERSSVKSRLGQRSRPRRGNSSTSGSSDNSTEPRKIVDLQDISGRDPSDVAKEMASKLYEEKDELLIRVVKVLGLDVPLELFKETQRIEADGGMMIMNGVRRRTPGGVFLFLLKHHDNVTPEQIKSIFTEERQNQNKSRKQIESLIRDRKVEELKKRLCENSTELPSLNSRKEIFLQGEDSTLQSQPGSLSNPPPSPVGQEQSSPEYKTHEITINLVDNADEPSTSKAASATMPELVTYDDEILDITCGDMDLF